jgi:hypothetical protein
MIKNNLKSILIHIFVSIVSLSGFMAFFAGQPKWISEEAARKHHLYMTLVAAIWIIATAGLYYILAKEHLNVLKNRNRILLSVSLPAALGTILWLLALIINPDGKNNSLFNSELWQYYGMYNGYAFFFISEIGIDNHYVLLLFSFIPSIAMGSELLYESHTKRQGIIG